MALKSDAIRRLAKAEDWGGFSALVSSGEYDKYSNQLKMVFWDFLCNNKQIKEIEDCLRLLQDGYSFDISYLTASKIESVLFNDLGALIHASNSKLIPLNDIAHYAIAEKFRISDYSLWPSLGDHKIMQTFLMSLSHGYNIRKQNVFNGIIDAKLNGIQVPDDLESFVLSLVMKKPLEYTMSWHEVPVSSGAFMQRSRSAWQSINYLDRACQEDNPKMLALTISTLGIKDYEYPCLGGFGLVDSMLARRSLNCLKEYLDKDAEFLIRPREYQEISRNDYNHDDGSPDYNSGLMKIHHPLVGWIKTIDDGYTKDEVAMMRVIYDNFKMLLKDSVIIPEMEWVKKIVEDLETKNNWNLLEAEKPFNLAGFEVMTIFKRAFEKILEAVNPTVEKYNSVNAPKSHEVNENGIEI